MPDQITRLLDDVQRLDQTTTPGPWYYEPGVNTQSGWYDGTVRDCATGESVTGETGDDDAEFIALSRTALPKLAEAVYHVLDLLDVVEKSDKYSYDFGGNKSPSLVTTNEVRKAITDTLGADGA